LHPIKGHVAQLNSAPDYGSGGCKFESCRGHYKQKVYYESNRLFYFYKTSKACFCKESENKKAAAEGGWTFYLQKRIQKDTEGNLAVVKQAESLLRE
jgi:hypothetical protein